MANKQLEGNEVVFRELGIFSDDPKDDQLINERLMEYLKSMDYEMPKIKFIGDDGKVKSKNKN